MLSDVVKHVVSHRGEKEWNSVSLTRKKMSTRETEVQVGACGKSCKRRVWYFKKTSEFLNTHF